MALPLAEAAWGQNGHRNPLGPGWFSQPRKPHRVHLSVVRKVPGISNSRHGDMNPRSRGGMRPRFASWAISWTLIANFFVEDRRDPSRGCYRRFRITLLVVDVLPHSCTIILSYQKHSTHKHSTHKHSTSTHSTSTHSTSTHKHTSTL
jgi:hypothetical protein